MEGPIKKTITAHCIIRNEENFIGYAIRSIIDHIDLLIVFDNGSTDRTVELVEGLVKQYGDKIIFKKKGASDKVQHTHLRQEMLEMTKTDWFMILDGDEVWTKRGIEEAIKMINENENLPFIVAPYYLCVGDIYHNYYKEWNQEYYGKPGFYTPRFIKREEGMYIKGDYEQDTFYHKDGRWVYTNDNLVFLKNKFWHLTHLRRSSSDDKVFTSGIAPTRAEKRRLTYFFIGRKINEPVPEVFTGTAYEAGMAVFTSFINFLKLFFGRPKLVFRRILTKIGLIKY